jgi:pentatricopeptide repeat domain-containing protein 1
MPESSILQSVSVLASWDRNVITYSAAVRACEKGEQRRPALGLLEVMQQSSVVPNVITYNAAVSAFEKGEQWRQAFRLLALSRAPAGGLHPQRCTMAAGTWSFGGDAAVKPTTPGQGFGIPSLTRRACGEGAQWQQALDLLVVMQQLGLVPNAIAYNATVSACGNRAEVRESAACSRGGLGSQQLR